MPSGIQSQSSSHNTSVDAFSVSVNDGEAEEYPIEHAGCGAEELWINFTGFVTGEGSVLVDNFQIVELN